MIEYPPLTPPVDSSRPPPFHEMNEHPKRFELLCMKLLSRDVGVEDVDLFGVTGQGQYGIDAIGGISATGGTVVQSSKCYPSVQRASQLTKWSNDFLEHLDGYWKDKHVERFILSVAATNLTSVILWEQIAAERARFEAVGIQFEVWGPEKLHERLLGHEDLARRFLGEPWRQIMFGPPAGGVVSAALIGQLSAAQSSLSNAVQDLLATGLERLRCGDTAGAEEILAATRSGQTWEMLTDEVKATALRLSGSMAFQRDNYDEAQIACDTAMSLHATEPRLAARLAAHRDGPSAGLRVLGKPSSIEGRQVEAGLLLSDHRLDEAEAVIDSLLRDNSSAPETLRLKGTLEHLRGHRLTALEFAQLAEEAAPSWRNIIQFAAVARYAASLSPSTPKLIAFHPNPPPAPLVKQDAASIEMRRQALVGFEKLLRLPGEDLPTLKLFRLACLGLLPGREADAAQQCRDILQSNPLCLEAVYWSLSRGYEIDRDTICARLEAIYASGEASEDQVRCLALLAIELRGGEADCATMLETSVHKLSDEARQEAEEWIRRFRLHAALPGDPPNGLEESLDYSRTKDALEDLLGRSPPDVAGYHLAERTADATWWELLEPFVDALAGFETAPAIKLAAHILFATRSASETLAFLNRHLSAFPESRLPTDLLRVQIGCLSNLGNFPEAIRIASTIAAETGRAVDRLNLAQMYAMSGNAQACGPIIRTALAQDELDAEEAFRFSVVLAVEDVSLAQKLWLSANQKGIPDSILLPALMHAYKLGLDKECGPLMVRLNLRANDGSGDVWTASVDDMVEQMKEHRERVEDVTAHLRVGAVSIHSVPSSVIGPLVSVYQLDAAAGDRAHQRVLFLRHGGRPRSLTPAKPWQDWQILLDVTGLLIADQLGLLGHVEALAAPTVISRSLVELLYGFERDVTHQQAARVQALREIMSARAKGLLALSSGDSSELETVRYAQDRSEISEAGPTVEGMIQTLGGKDVEAGNNEGQSRLALTPPRGSRLFFNHNTLESISASGCLVPMLGQYRCEISQEAFDDVVAEVEAAEAGDKLSKRIRDLRERVATGLQNGRYVVSARDYLGGGEGTEEGELIGRREVSALEACLFDLIQAPGIKGAFHWCDDRYLSSFSHSNENIVVGVVEVLNALVRDGLVSEDEGRAKLLQLRSGGSIFIPLDTTEVIAWLNMAPIVDGILVETPALIVLRRNLAAALRQDPYLKIGDNPAFPTLSGRPDETLFLTASQKVLEDCIFQIWADGEASEDVCRARCDWLWANLRVEQCVRATPDTDPGRGNEVLTAVLFAGILAKLPTLIFGKTIRESWDRQQALAAWFSAAALEPRSHAMRFQGLVAEYFRTLINETFGSEMEREEEGRQVALRLRQEHMRMLPDSIQDLILEDSEFAARVGTEALQIIAIENEKFDVESFWSSVIRALRNGRSSLTSTAGVEVEVRRTGKAIAVRGAVSGRLDEPYLNIMAATKRARPSLAKRYLEQLDITATDREGFSERLAAASSDAAYVRVLEKATLACPSGHYARLKQRLTTERRIERAVFMPPRADRLLLYLRLGPADGPLRSRLPAAWDDLSNRFGKAEAFGRLSGLPVDLASLLLHQAIEPADLASCGGPVALFHRAALAKRSGQNPDAIVATALPAEGGVGHLFQTLLEWSAKAFEGDETWWPMDPTRRLTVIWAHAHFLTEAISEITDQFATVAELFVNQQPHRDISGVIAERWETERDCSWPDTLNDISLFYHGLGYVYGSCPRQEMGAAILDFVDRAMIVGEEPDRLPAFPLLRRSTSAANALDSWLGWTPLGILPGGIDPSAYRDDLLDRALAELKKHPAHREAWMTVCAVAPPALSARHRALVEDAFAALKLADFLSDGEPIAICPAVIACRVGLGSPLPEGVLAGKLHAFAKACARAFPGRVTLKDQQLDGRPTKGAEAMSTVVSVVAEAATGPRGTVAFENLHNAAIAIAHGWPECAGPLRAVFDNLVRQSPPADAHGLWRTFVWLRSWA